MNTSRITRKTGIGTDTSQLLDFIKAPIEDIIHVLESIVPIEIQRNVYGRCIKVDNSGYLFYQIRDNAWTTIEYIATGHLQISRYIPEAIKTLRVKAVHYEYNDTTEFMNYVCFDSTGVLESYDSNTVSKQYFEEDVDPVSYVDQLLKDQGIYALCGGWSGHFSSPGSSLEIIDPSISPNDFIAFHYVILPQ